MDATDRSGPIVSDYEPCEPEQSFINNGRGISFRATTSRGPEVMYLAANTSQFRKWLNVNAPETDLTVDEAPTLALHSHDFWMPLAILASDVTLQVYLGLVTNYIYDQLKGALRHDKHEVHLSVVHEDKTAGKLKRFDYSGPVEGLSKCVFCCPVTRDVGSMLFLTWGSGDEHINTLFLCGVKK